MVNKKQQKVAEPKVKKAILKKPKVPIKVAKKIAKTKKIVKPIIAAVKRRVVISKKTAKT